MQSILSRANRTKDIGNETSNLRVFSGCFRCRCRSAAERTRPDSVSNALITAKIPGADRELPVIGIGTARRYADPDGEAELAALKATIARFLELGGQVIDTAPSYGKAEEVLGQLVEALGVRDRLFLATKVGVNNREEGVKEVEQSFARLRTKRIDLIAVHNLRDIDNQLAILRDLKASGRIRALDATTSTDRQYPTHSAAGPGAGICGDDQPSVRPRAVVRSHARPSAARLGGGDQRHQLGTSFPEVHRVASVAADCRARHGPGALR